jgi:hypothetical protein
MRRDRCRKLHMIPWFQSGRLAALDRRCELACVQITTLPVSRRDKWRPSATATEPLAVLRGVASLGTRNVSGRPPRYANPGVNPRKEHGTSPRSAVDHFAHRFLRFATSQIGTELNVVQTGIVTMFAARSCCDDFPPAVFTNVLPLNSGAMVKIDQDRSVCLM